MAEAYTSFPTSNTLNPYISLDCNDLEELGINYYNARWYDPQLGRFITEDPIKDGNNWYMYAAHNPLRYIDPTGLWVDNTDGTFEAEKGDTLSGLSQETGKDWESSNYTGKPEELQIGQIVDMGKKDSNQGDAPVISNTGEAEDLYDNGDGSPAWIDDNVLEILKNSDKQKEKENERIKSGATTQAEGSYGINLASKNWLFGKNSGTDDEGMFFVGDTPVDYKISMGTKTTIVDFTAFIRDGFWDLPLKKGPSDGIGPGSERKGSTPYAFIPRTWSISFPNPETVNWE